MQIGEAPMVSVKSALRYISGDDRVLDMMIQFDAMTADCFFTEYLHHPFSLRKLKRAYSRWQNGLAGKGWNALYLENHDHPRVVSRYGSERLRRESATALAASYLFQQGCPFIYQGQEIGMTNIRLPSIEQYLDVASKNLYHMFHRHQSEEKRMRRIHNSSRDSARTPMQWSSAPNAGFCPPDAKPWLFVNENYREINAANEEEDPYSVLYFYRRCLKLRRESDTLIFGDYKEYFPRSGRVYVYERTWQNERILVLVSFSHLTERVRLPDRYMTADTQLLLDNYPGEHKVGELRPYEAQVLRISD